MTKTLQEQLMNVLLVTAAQNVDYALTVDGETSPHRSDAPASPLRASGGAAARRRRAHAPSRPQRRADSPARPLRASGGAAARHRRADAPSRPLRPSSPQFGPSLALPQLNGFPWFISIYFFMITIPKSKLSSFIDFP